MIKVCNVTKQIKGKTVLDKINFELEKGKIYGLEGHNGSGKTMFLRLLCRLILPSSGEVIIDDNTTFGVLIENPGFLFNETGFNNLKFLASINKKIGFKEIEQVLKDVGLYDSKDIKVKKYSLGMLQKLGIAQAIMETPNVLLLDEPFNALDEESVKITKKLLLKAASNGTSIIIVSHTLQDFKHCCDYLYTMNNGNLKLMESKTND